MKNITLTTLFLIFISIIYAQNVTTFAGPDVGINDALIIDKEGNLYGSYFNGNYNSAAVTKITPGGDISVFVDGFHSCNGLAFDSEDNLIVIDFTGNFQHQLYKVNKLGEKSEFGPIVRGASGIVKDPNSDTVYISSYSNHKIFKLSPDGDLTEFYDGPELLGPVGLAIDDDDNLYTANFTDGKIIKIALDLLSIEEIADITDTNFGGVGFLAYTNGYLYATGIGDHKIYKLSTDGDLSLLAGTGNAGSDDGTALQATFNRPNGIYPSLTGDSLYISDYATQSIRIISGLNGNTTGIFSPVDININVYPNPSKDGFINIESDQLMQSIEIYDLLGKISKRIKEVNSNQYKLSLSKKSSLLILKVYYTDNKYLIRRISTI